MVDMTWPEIEQAIQRKAVVLLPVGVIEEHGPHMGLAVDTYVSCTLCRRIKQNLAAREKEALIAPPYYWGINDLTGCFPGSFNVRLETMKAVLVDTLSSLNKWGVTYVFVVNWHGEYKHNLAILEAVKEARESTGIQSYFILTASSARNYKLSGQEEYIILEEEPEPEIPPAKYADLHAGSLETGIMLNLFPEQVNRQLAANLEATRVTFDDLKAVRKDDDAVRRLIPSGYFGDPAGYNLETANQIIEEKAGVYTDLIERALKSK
jgi:creatinine amidohydrolase